MENSEAKQVGLKDQPIESIEQEALGLDEYAEVLTEFIQRCDTPLTIALQGDWGSGKTSLMTLIKNALDAKTNDGAGYLTVWFNTWQYSQFSMSDTLALSMMSKMTDELASENETELFQTVKRSLWAATRTVAIGGASLIGQADTTKEFLDEAERGLAGSGEEDPVKTLEKIKDGLGEMVQERTAGSVEKVVIFIDDLDRLIPAKAVELLEAMKVFLDIDRCVYVIACDYGVVSTGLKEKFGVSEGELKGKSFFDKIIQVPFKMPTRRYRVDQYIESLLKRIGMDFDVSKDIDTYCELVDHSVGFNPRTMKRLINTLQLLTILDSKRRQREENKRLSSNDDMEDRQRHNCRVTFAILCMLETYEEIHEFLTKNLTAEKIIGLRDGLKEGDNYDGLRVEIGANSAGDDVAKDARLEKAVQFCETFVDCLQLDQDSSLSHDEIRHLEEMLSQTALVNASPSREEFSPREFAQGLKSELNKKYARFVARERRPHYGKFRIDAGRVYLDLVRDKLWLYMGREDNSGYYFAIWASEYVDVRPIGRRICEQLGWEMGREREEDPEVYDFFTQPLSDQDALEKYKAELFKRLDVMTSKQRLLEDLVS